jgi:predicted metal-dependent peptidase
MSIFVHRYRAVTKQIMIISNAIETVLRKEPHLKPIIDKTNIKEIDDDKFSCAAIYVDSNGISLIINKRKLLRLTKEERASVLAHEYGHVTLGHLTLRDFHAEDRFMVCLAQDIALNDGLSETFRLPVWFATPRSLGLPRGLATSQYLSILKSMNRKDLSKMVKIPEYQIEYDRVQNRKYIKGLIDEIQISY